VVFEVIALVMSMDTATLSKGEKRSCKQLIEKETTRSKMMRAF